MDRLPSAKIRDSLEQRIVEGELGNGKRLDFGGVIWQS